jgi:hypothetical protein
MFNKLFKSKYVYVILIGVVLFWIMHTKMYRENFMNEYFDEEESKKINEITDTINKNSQDIHALQTDFITVGKKMEAQGQQAAAAQASLQSITNTGVNKVMPI